MKKNPMVRPEAPSARRPVRRYAVIAAIFGALAIAAPAQASSCTHPSGAVVVTMPSATDVAALRRVGDAIYNGAMPCGGATVYDTDLILVHDTTPDHHGDDLVGIDLSGGPLAPGKVNEGPGGVSEIEIFLYLYYGKNAVLVDGSAGADDIRAGSTLGGFGPVRGINLNAGLEQGKVSDADVTYQEPGGARNPADYEPITFDGGEGDDTIGASGGAGFDGPLAQPITLIGSSGNDHLVGGGVNDMFYADAGNDVIDGGDGLDTVTYETSAGPATVDLSKKGPQATGVGGTDQFARVERLVGSHHDDVLTGDDGDNVIEAGDGNDVLTGRGGNDKLDGGSGSDTASYRQVPAGATQGVRVNLGNVGAQYTGGAGSDTLAGIENLAGSPFADQLTGDARANTITGWQGQDSLEAGEGDDHLAVRDGTRDLVTCGPGGDAVDADARGVDSIFGDCEKTAFAPSLPPPGGGTGPGPAVPPVLDQLTLDPRTFSVARSGPSVASVIGTRVSYRLSEAATVTFAVQRAGTGRRVRGRCVRPTSKNRRASRCRRWLRVRGSFTRSGLTGVNGLHFSGRVAGGRLRPGRYRLRAIARDTDGNRSRRRTARFTIVRR